MNKLPKELQTELNNLKEAIKLQKARAEMAEYLFKEAYYAIEFSKLKDQYPEFFNNSNEQTNNTNNTIPYIIPTNEQIQTTNYEENNQ